MMLATWTLPPVLGAANSNDAVELLRRYFKQSLEGQPAFTGAAFDQFDGGGNRPDLADRFTAADIVAVSMLSVNVPPEATLRLLSPDQVYLSSALSAIPRDIDLVDATDADLAAADHLWRLVRKVGVGPVTSSKLLARKRPRFLPVVDRVVKDELSHPRRADFYRTLQYYLSADQRALHRHLEHLRELAGISEDISVIRCFDIIVWLTGRYPSAHSESTTIGN